MEIIWKESLVAELYQLTWAGRHQNTALSYTFIQ